MAKTSVQIELNSNGIEALLSGGEVRDMVGAEAQRIASAAGSGYGTDVRKVGDRMRGEAYTATKEAMQDNLENNTLLKAAGASGWDREG